MFREVPLKGLLCDRRRDCEPGCLLVCGPQQMLPLAKKYFYTSLNDAITANEIKWAT